ncbi:MAG: class II aldolase/adducin family protein [Pseudomonadota bacterium]
MNRSQEFQSLTELSAKAGKDPLLIQAAGGNTSCKLDDVMWIKSSGTQLAEADSRDIFVPVDWKRMRDVLGEDIEAADQPVNFLSGEHTMRPSIETSLHAIFEQKIVVHVHCVNTIAVAIRADAETVLGQKLAGFDWAFVPYIKPGARLANAVKQRLKPTTDVIVLGNHGLIVAADTVSEAGALLERVVDAHRAPTPDPKPVSVDALEQVAASGYVPFEDGHPLHQIALSSWHLEAAKAGSLYPDHVLFCGIAATVLEGEETVDALRQRFEKEDQEPPVLLLIPGKGALMRSDMTDSAKALARCLGDVLLRTEEGSALTYLTLDQNFELLDWDAEKYRKALNG